MSIAPKLPNKAYRFDPPTWSSKTRCKNSSRPPCKKTAIPRHHPARRTCPIRKRGIFGSLLAPRESCRYTRLGTEIQERHILGCGESCYFGRCLRLSRGPVITASSCAWTRSGPFSHGRNLLRTGIASCNLDWQDCACSHDVIFNVRILAQPGKIPCHTSLPKPGKWTTRSTLSGLSITKGLASTRKSAPYV